MLVCVLMLAACLPTAAFAVDAGITTGDVNGDEAVDVKDVVLMIRFLTGWDVGISEEYGDFDGNGRIDMARSDSADKIYSFIYTGTGTETGTRSRAVADRRGACFGERRTREERTFTSDARHRAYLECEYPREGDSRAVFPHASER